MKACSLECVCQLLKVSREKHGAHLPNLQTQSPLSSWQTGWISSGLSSKLTDLLVKMPLSVRDQVHLFLLIELQFMNPTSQYIKFIYIYLIHLLHILQENSQVYIEDSTHGTHSRKQKRLHQLPVKYSVCKKNCIAQTGQYRTSKFKKSFFSTLIYLVSSRFYYKF